MWTVQEKCCESISYQCAANRVDLLINIWDPNCLPEFGFFGSNIVCWVIIIYQCPILRTALPCVTFRQVKRTIIWSQAVTWPPRLRDVLRAVLPAAVFELTFGPTLQAYAIESAVKWNTNLRPCIFIAVRVDVWYYIPSIVSPHANCIIRRSTQDL